MKNYFKAILLLFVIAGCSDDENLLSSENRIRRFVINGTQARIDQSEGTISAIIPSDQMINALTPEITISEGASVEPPSGQEVDFTLPVTYTVTAADGSVNTYEVSLESSIAGFQFEGHDYEIVRETMTWQEAVAFSVNRGGYLVEIQSENEQRQIFSELLALEINTSILTISEVWIGGNDVETEGEWFWDGDNQGARSQFWSGDVSGMAVNGAYTNWGEIEPDNVGDQDALTIILEDTPFNFAGQWNDRNVDNNLYFIIEYD